MTRCTKVGPKTGEPCSLERYHAAEEHEARGPRGRVLERWPKRNMGKRPKPVDTLRRASDGTREIKFSGVPDPVLEAIQEHADSHPLRYRSRNTLLALCAIEGWEVLRARETKRSAGRRT